MLVSSLIQSCPIAENANVAPVVHTPLLHDSDNTSNEFTRFSTKLPYCTDDTQNNK